MSEFEEYDNSFGGNDDTYFFAEGELKNAMFKVSIIPWRLIANIVVLFIPPIAYFIAWPMLYALELVGYTTTSIMFKFFMALTFFCALALLFWNAGKKVEVTGKDILIRSFFIFQEPITLDQVYKCEVITGLSVHSRYRTEYFSKAVLYYGNNSKVSFNDNMYKGWNEMVKYMEIAGKTVYIDGRSKFTKAMENWLGRR